MNDWISDFRGGRSQGNLGAWVLAATLLSVGLHLILWKYAGNLGLPEHFGGVAADMAVEQRIPVDLRRARINEEAAMLPAPPAAAVEEREPPPPTTEPVDLTQFKELQFDELKLTAQVEMPTNIRTGSGPVAGDLTTAVASALAAVPVAVADDVPGSPLATAIEAATATLAVDPQISQDQVVLAAEDLVVEGDVLGQSITAATTSGNQGVGEKDGLASLDDLLAYTGPMTEDRTAMMPTDLLFEYNSSELKETARLSLMKLGFIIQKNPEAEISIEGHSDTFGGDAYNLTLSEARANAVKNWLVESLRLEAARLNTRGWGKAKLLVPAGDVAAQQKNRRVEIVIRPKK